ncbi:MAG: isocitrate lyase/phosphoenolpyruvate mutase family protein [Candidatus Woesearchaeota archaeon]
MTLNSKSKRLRELFNSNSLIRIVGAHDGMSAKLVEKHGFEGVWASGLEISTSHGVPDAEILTMNDTLHAAVCINDAIKLPVVVDCDTGYGNSINVIRLVEKFEAAGIAAVCIEDKIFPKVNSYVPGRQELAPIAEFVGKIMAAKNAQKTEEFMVFARVEALIAGWGHEEAIKRAKAYMNAGADAIFIHSKAKVPDEIVTFVNEWNQMNKKIPLVVCPTSYPSFSESQMKELGVNMVIYANHGIRAAILNMNNVLGKISKEGIGTLKSDELASMDDVFEIQGMPQMKETEKLFLRSEDPVSVIIPAAGKYDEDAKLSELLADRPVTMLDVNGKSILQRNVEIFNNMKITNVNVVAGYRADSITLKNINLVSKGNYDSEYILSSIMHAKDCFKGKTLIMYSDILFDKRIAEELIKKDDDFILVVDKSYNSSKFVNKYLDLVVTKYKPMVGDRFVNPERSNYALKLGNGVSREEANAEFIGMMLMSENGSKIMQSVYEEISSLDKLSSASHLAQITLEKADILDMMQELINRGHKVSVMEISGGWIEVDSFDNYKLACSLLGNYTEGL